jgi:hypothetical protein
MKHSRVISLAATLCAMAMAWGVARFAVGSLSFREIAHETVPCVR